MAGVGLWAALPLGLLAAVLSIGGGWTGRGDLAVVGGRAAEATAAILLISTAGLGYALVTVRLDYAYVASLSSFQEAWLARLAGLWSGPAGAALALTFLIFCAAALSYRLGGTRNGAGRTGALAVLGVFGIVVLLTQAQPFARPGSPAAAAGAGLAPNIAAISWQLELWASMLAVTCAAFTLAGAVGESIAESQGARGRERGAVRWTAGALTVALMAAGWRAYAGSGRLIDATGLATVAVYLPGWLVALAYLHAPGGVAVPIWAARWRRLLGVALFPTTLGGVVALLAGAGSVPPDLPWVAGLAVGIVSGALVGIGRRGRGAESLRAVPGFGLWASQGGFAALTLAGLAAVWGTVRGPFWDAFGPAAILVALAGAGAWAVTRPAGGWRRVWPAALGFGVLGAAGGYGLSGWGDAAFALTAGLTAAVAVGFVADLVRLRAAGRAAPPVASIRGGGGQSVSALIQPRARRRWSSALAHLGLAFVVLGLAAGGLTRWESESLGPGDTLAIETAGGEVRAVYLGLSRYQTGDVDKRVASFSLYRGDRAPELVTASLIWDPASRRQSRTPHIERGALGDVVVSLIGLRGGESILGSLAVRPLSGLVWLGGTFLLASIILVRRTNP